MTTITTDASSFFTDADGNEIARGGNQETWDRFVQAATELMSGVPTASLEDYFEVLVTELGEIQLSIEEQRKDAR